MKSIGIIQTLLKLESILLNITLNFYKTKAVEEYNVTPPTAFHYPPKIPSPGLSTNDL